MNGKRMKAKRIYIGIVLLILICVIASACGKTQGKAKKDGTAVSDDIQTPEPDKEAAEVETEEELYNKLKNSFFGFEVVWEKE